MGPQDLPWESVALDNTKTAKIVINTLIFRSIQPTSDQLHEFQKQDHSISPGDVEYTTEGLDDDDIMRKLEASQSPLVADDRVLKLLLDLAHSHIIRKCEPVKAGVETGPGDIEEDFKKELIHKALEKQLKAMREGLASTHAVESQKAIKRGIDLLQVHMHLDDHTKDSIEIAGELKTVVERDSDMDKAAKTFLTFCFDKILDTPRRAEVGKV